MPLVLFKGRPSQPNYQISTLTNNSLNKKKNSISLKINLLYILYKFLIFNNKYL
jgi:hypothetical protein